MEEIEDLCLLIGSRAAGRTVPEAGSVVIVERLTAMLALVVIARPGVAVAVAGAVEPTELGVALCRSAGVPVVADLTGIYAWARPGDRMLIDGDAGLVRVNPPPTAVARFRAER